MNGVTVIFGVVIALWLAWVIWCQVSARRQRSVTVGLTPDQAVDVVVAAMGRPTRQVEDTHALLGGRGDLNFEKRIGRYKPIIATSYQVLPTGATDVSLWLSGYHTAFGLVRNAFWVARKLGKAEKALQRASTPTTATIERVPGGG